jgi:hypothetical protein
VQLFQDGRVLAPERPELPAGQSLLERLQLPQRAVRRVGVIEQGVVEIEENRPQSYNQSYLTRQPRRLFDSLPIVL